MNLGKAVNSCRLERKMTLADLEAETGLSKSFLSRIESNGRDVSMEALSKIATAFGISPALLMFLAADDAERGPLSGVGDDLNAIIMDLVKSA